jgi:hypothetical protein
MPTKLAAIDGFRGLKAAQNDGKIVSECQVHSFPSRNNPNERILCFKRITASPAPNIKQISATCPRKVIG